MENNDMLNTLMGLLGDNAEEKIGKVMSALQSNNEKPINVEDDIVINQNEDKPPMQLLQNNSADSLRRCAAGRGHRRRQGHCLPQ